jgi:hypothetical protein
MVIGIESDWYRIMDDAGEPTLFDPQFFTILSAKEPKEWIIEMGEDGEKYAYPLKLSCVGFFDDYFNDNIECILTLLMYMQQRCAQRES